MCLEYDCGCRAIVKGKEVLVATLCSQHAEESGIFEEEE